MQAGRQQRYGSKVHYCSRCNQAGHNRRSCPQILIDRRRAEADAYLARHPLTKKLFK